jgi:hypothetical protein
MQLKVLSLQDGTVKIAGLKRCILGIAPAIGDFLITIG